MKKIIVFVLTIFILFSGFATQSYALSDSQSAAIQALLDDACRISGVRECQSQYLLMMKCSTFLQGMQTVKRGCLQVKIHSMS